MTIFFANQFAIGKNSRGIRARPLCLRSPVLKFIFRKLVQGILLVVIVSAAVFLLLSAAGGDALSGLRENPQVSAETVERLRVYYALDRPVGERYLRWAADAARGDLGESISFRTPVASMVGSRLLETLKLSAVTLLLALGVSLLFSFLIIRTRSRALDRLAEAFVLVFASTPVIVTSLVVLATVAAASTFAAAGSIIFSAVALAPPFIGLFLAQTKRGFEEAMRENFVQLARSKGLSETAVIIRHAARAAINPLITLLGLSIGALVSGSVIVETVLGRQGIGSLTVAAVRSRDVPLVMGIVLIVSIAVWLGNTIGEFLQMANDRRLFDAERN